MTMMAKILIGNRIVTRGSKVAAAELHLLPIDSVVYDPNDNEPWIKISRGVWRSLISDKEVLERHYFVYDRILKCLPDMDDEEECHDFDWE